MHPVYIEHISQVDVYFQYAICDQSLIEQIISIDMMKQSLFVVVLGIFLFVTIGSSASLPLNNTIYEDETKIEKTENHDMKDFDSYQKQFRQEMLEAHNQYRARHCAPPLTLDNNLNNEAQKHAEHLIHINQVESSTIQDLNENRTAEFIVQSIPKYSGKYTIYHFKHSNEV